MSEEELSKIHRYLYLDKVDERLKLKRDIMKRVIKLTSKWKKGTKQEWIDKIANRTCISTRKTRENYVEPLITDRILREHGNGNIEFVGLPKGAEIITETIKCAQCGKDITEQVNSEQEFFQYHGLKFCNKKCYDKYLKKLEKEDLPHG